MERRLILAIALSLLVLLSWSALVSKQNPPPATEAKVMPGLAVTPKPELPPSSLFKFSQEKFEITFSEPQGAIKEVIFKAHQNYKFPLQYGFFLGDNALSFKKASSADRTVTFVHSDQNKEIIKVFIFSNTDYSVELKIEMRNLSNLLLKMDLPLVLGVLDFDPKNVQSRYQDVTVATQDKIVRLSPRQDLFFTGIKFLGLRDRYFCGLIEPEAKDYTGVIRKINAQEFEIGLRPAEITLSPGQTIAQKFRIYLGPQDLQLIKRINPAWSAIIHYGTFDFISQLLLQLLGVLYWLVHNWGWAIVILSLVVYFILYPLTLKQMRSMKETQALQPHIEELRRTYKDNPQKLNKEIMELYRRHKVNPFGGCLPLILQIPIFFALYQALMRSVVLKGANFLWIKDLSEPDRLFVLAKSLPIIGNEINILPIVMATGMFLQQKISLVAATGSSAEQQKMMLIIMPVMFGLIFYHMPAGLVLYWFINSALTLANQWRINRER